MTYQALYRKYRPSSLNDVVGQDIIIKIIQNEILNNKICHAYMFSGSRGIGKTSIAKLLAKTVNCLNLNNGDACGKCENCLAINEGSCPDIIEIDAASNNGVDEIREIKNKINLVPNQLKYKVYIIDEVHMLSIGAFNALLKTLEEPPEHIIFILATTDLQKVPMTIISRCQCFEFHRISNLDIANRLDYICQNEKITIEKKVLNLIANLSDGSLRDAVGMLDQLNAYSNSNITVEDFENVNGIVSDEKQIEFIDYINKNEIENVIKFLDTIYDNGKNLTLFIQNLIYQCKNLCIDYYINNNSKYNINFLLTFSTYLTDLIKEIKMSSDPKTIIEISLLSFINKNIPKKGNIIDNNSQLDSKIISREIIYNDSENEYLELRKIIINNCFATATKKDKNNFESKFETINEYALDSVLGVAACFVSDGHIRAVSEKEIILSFDYESVISRGIPLIPKIKKLFEKIYDNQYNIALLTESEWNIEKENFIKNKNNNIQYEYIDVEKKEKEIKNNLSETNNIANEAIELFGKDVISVN